MKRRVEQYIREQKMLPAGCRVILGFSGGGDSMALYHILQELQETLDFTLYAVHVHHGLRGREADRDAAMVKEVCARDGVPLEIRYFFVEEYARREKLGVEEAGRLLRRKCFQEKKARLLEEKSGEVRIALAHHANDLAETMLHHMARGTGLRGLGAMRPVEGDVIRPFLCLERKEIEQYLKEQEIPYAEDSTNLSDHYTRNRIRHMILPLLEKEVNPRAAVHLGELAGIAASADAYLENCSKELRKRLTKPRQQGIFLSEEYEKEAEILKMYLLRDILGEVAGQEKDLTQIHLHDILRLGEKQVGRKLDLPYGIQVNRTYGGLLFLRTAAGGGTVEEVTLSVPGRTAVPGGALETRIFFAEGRKIPEKKYTKWLDYDKIKEKLTVRSRKTGDYLVVNASGARKKLNRYFIDGKIPGEKRDEIPLVVSGSEVLWILGGRINENYKVQAETRRILELKYEGGENHEREDPCTDQ